MPYTHTQMPCRWGRCTNPATRRNVCDRHYQATLRAGARARANGEAKVADTEYRLDELEHLLDGGVWPSFAVERLGWSMEAAVKAAKKRDRPELARRLASPTAGAA